MKTLRTPDPCFENLPGYSFQPNYTDVPDGDGGTLRIHHVDEGPKDGPVVLCMHGQPTWSYLYRHMIPVLVEGGLRVIAPDLVGFGRSDKPAARENYTYQRQVDWLTHWLVKNDLQHATFFGQDWGGLIGLRMVAENPDRFDRVVISNTGLPVAVDVPDEVIEEYRRFRKGGSDADTPGDDGGNWRAGGRAFFLALRLLAEVVLGNRKPAGGGSGDREYSGASTHARGSRGLQSALSGPLLFDGPASDA